MSFLRCPDCRRSVSDRIQTCPDCGYPLCSLDTDSPEPDQPPKKRKMLVGWSAIVAVLYGLIQLTFFEILSGGKLGPQGFGLIGVAVLCQWALIKVPVQIEARRPLKRTALWIPLVMSGLCMAATVFGLGLTISDMFDDSTVFNFWPFAFFGTWIVWCVVFWRMSRHMPVTNNVVRQNRLLLRGSILELLIAVPTHVVARNRDECCAGIPSAIGIWLGLSVAFLAFGPSLFFLYAARYRKVRRL